MIQCKNLSKEYPSCKALSEFSYEFPLKGLVALVGESGSGKTTLLNMLGLLDAPSSGSISFEGKALLTAEEKADYRKHHISFLFQDSLLLEQLSVRENISFPLELNHSQIRSEDFDRLADFLGVSPLMEKRVNELSSGQKQRIAFMRAMVKAPRILLADEPTGNLDRENTQKVFELLKQASENCLVIVATHDTDMARQFADEILTLDYGKLTGSEKKTFSRASSCEISVSPQKAGTSLMPFMLRDTFFKRNRLVKVLLISILTLVISALSLSIFSVSRKEVLEVENNYLYSNVIELSKPDSNRLKDLLLDSISFYPGIREDLSFLDKNEKVADYTCDYLIPQLMAGNGIEDPVKVDGFLIQLSDYFKTGILKKQITGSFPENSDEIILSNEIAEKLFPGEKADALVGRTITLFAEGCEDCGIPVTIVGINYEVSVGGSVFTYIPDELIRALFELVLEDESVHFVISENSYFITEEDGKKKVNYREVEGVTPLAVGSPWMSPLPPGLEVEYGELADSSGKLVVNKCFIRQYFFLFFDGPTPEDLDVFLSNDQNLKKILSTPLSVIWVDLMEGHVTGITDDQIEYPMLYLEEEDLEFLKSPRPYKVRIYVKDQGDVSTVREDCIGRGIAAEKPYSYLQEHIGNGMNSIALLLGVMGIILIILSAFSINAFSQNNILESTKDIGLLCSFGAGKKEILEIYGLQAVLIGAVCGLAAAIVYPVAVFLLNLLYQSGVMAYQVRVEWYICVLLPLFGVLLQGISALPSLLKAAKVNPIRSIRSIR